MIQFGARIKSHAPLWTKALKLLNLRLFQILGKLPIYQMVTRSNEHFSSPGEKISQGSGIAGRSHHICALCASQIDRSSMRSSLKNSSTEYSARHPAFDIALDSTRLLARAAVDAALHAHVY
jgi:hypothetical protein